jgi:hypothetical protein
MIFICRSFLACRFPTFWTLSFSSWPRSFLFSLRRRWRSRPRPHLTEPALSPIPILLQNLHFSRIIIRSNRFLPFFSWGWSFCVFEELSSPPYLW